MTSALKEEIIEKINATDDIRLLNVLKADIDHLTEFGGVDIVEELNETDRAELINLANEPDDFEVISQSEFDKIIGIWHLK